jgi:tRNA dimethylallyltransferase
VTTSAPRASVALVGTTASGKSALAHEIALTLGNVEIATVDSMTVYREMDLATAKPSRAQRAAVPYHLLDLVDPSDEFTVAEFQRAARAAERQIVGRGQRVLYVGGTGLYGRVVIDDFDIPGRYPLVRKSLEAQLPEGLAALFDQLSALDPVSASRMESSNERRVVRALEVTLGSGRPFSSFGPGLESYPDSGVHQIGLRVPMDEIDHRIESRLLSWMNEGLLDEVRHLSGRPGGLSRTARQAVGYRELLTHVEAGVPLDEALVAATTATRRLARRQRSWFGRDPRIEWFDDATAARERLVTLLTSTPANVGN